MRKEYQKPAVYAESFELCEHITKTCDVIKGIGGIATHWDASAGCGFRTDGPNSDQVLFYGSDPCNINANDFEDGFIPEGIVSYHGQNLNYSDLFSS